MLVLSPPAADRSAVDKHILYNQGLNSYVFLVVIEIIGFNAWFGPLSYSSRQHCILGTNNRPLFVSDRHD